MAIAAGAGGGGIILLIIIILIIRRRRRNANVRLSDTSSGTVFPSTLTPAFLKPNTTLSSSSSSSSSALVSSNPTSDGQFRNKASTSTTARSETPPSTASQWSDEYALEKLPMRRATIGWADNYAVQSHTRPENLSTGTKTSTYPASAPTYEGINDDPSVTYEYISDAPKHKLKTSFPSPPSVSTATATLTANPAAAIKAHATQTPNAEQTLYDDALSHPQYGSRRNSITYQNFTIPCVETLPPPIQPRTSQEYDSVVHETGFYGNVATVTYEAIEPNERDTSKKIKVLNKSKTADSERERGDDDA